MLQHVTQPLEPSQLKACIGFYELLGFTRVQAPPGIAGRATWMQRGAGQIHLMPGESPRPGSGHVGLVVDDYEATLRTLGDRGHQVDHRKMHWGSPRAYVHDPAGNTVELMAFPPETEAASGAR